MITEDKNHFGDRLFNSIRKKGNYLCLGIDPHLNLIPKVFQNKIKITNTPYSKNNIKIVEYFCKNLIDAIANLIPVIKIQIAFFEQLGPEGMKLLSKLCYIIKKKKIICIIDCKRGDIGSTNHGYANAFFSPNNPYPCDAITLNPWLGIETLNAFEKFIPKYGLFILVHTSNSGSRDLQEQITTNNKKLYEVLIEKLKPLIFKNLGRHSLSSVGIVTGATYPKEILSIRKKLPFAPFLIPGFGAQGGTLDNAKLGLVSDEPYSNKFNFGIINSSRGLCFPKSANNCKDIKSWKKQIYCNLQKNITNLNT